VETPARVLAAIPPTELGPVVAGRAAEIARSFSAELCLAACVYDPYVAGERFSDSPELQAAREALTQARRTELDEMAGRLQTDGLNVSIAVNWAYPVYAGLVELAESLRADLLVAGTFHHRLFERWGLANTDWQLLRHTPCPLLLVRGDGFDGYRSILAAVDPMHAQDAEAALDGRILEAAKVFARPWDSRVDVLHAYLESEHLPMVAPGVAGYYGRLSSRTEHARAVEELVSRHQLAQSRVLLEAGDASQLIAEIAQRRDADLVVMGAVSRSRLRQLLVGSTAESVLDDLDCDVLVVRGSTA
jgi:universal stress protein E